MNNLLEYLNCYFATKFNFSIKFNNLQDTRIFLEARYVPRKLKTVKRRYQTARKFRQDIKDAMRRLPTHPCLIFSSSCGSSNNKNPYLGLEQLERIKQTTKISVGFKKG